MIPDARYKQIMAGLGMPNSQSLLCALQQVANEVGQKHSADAIDLEDAAEKARARAMLNELKWQRVSHDKEALQDQIDACRPYLKEGETPAECLARNRMDIDRLMGFLATEKTARENLQADAARYRWLRMNRLWLLANLAEMTHAGDFDEAIDEARAAQEVAE